MTTINSPDDFLGALDAFIEQQVILNKDLLTRMDREERRAISASHNVTIIQHPAF